MKIIKPLIEICKNNKEMYEMVSKKLKSIKSHYYRREVGIYQHNDYEGERLWDVIPDEDRMWRAINEFDEYINTMKKRRSLIGEESCRNNLNKEVIVTDWPFKKEIDDLEKDSYIIIKFDDWMEGWVVKRGRKYTPSLNIRKFLNGRYGDNIKITSLGSNLYEINGKTKRLNIKLKIEKI